MLARILLLITSACGQRQLNRSHYAGAHATYAEQRQRIQAAVGNYTFYVFREAEMEEAQGILRQIREYLSLATRSRKTVHLTLKYDTSW